MLPTIADVERAAARIRGGVVRTPCLHSETLSELTGAAVWVKFENLQFTGSFKDRGSLNRLLDLDPEQRTAGVIALSAGNHAQGVAHHARRLGIPATIVMPATTPYAKVRGTAVLGAEVIQAGEDLSECVEVTERLVEERGLTLVHPYNDPEVIAGQGTCGLEIFEDAPDLDDVIVPVGGGGLISGVALAMAARRPQVQVIGVQTERYDAVARRFGSASDEPTTLREPTLADGIAVKQPGALTLALIDALVTDVLTVDEAAIESAIALYLDIEKTVAEGAGAISLAALIENPDRFRDRNVCCILSGGNIDTRLLTAVLTRQLVRQGRLTRLRIEADDAPGSLAEITRIISDAGANIVEVNHQRLVSSLSAQRVGIDVVVETRDRTHTAAVTDALVNAAITLDLNQA